jgi:hypothetical protein
MNQRNSQMSARVIEYCLRCDLWKPIDCNTNEQIDHGVRDNRRISTNESASESNITHSEKRCKDGICDRREYSIPT